jgi:CubicO group peptidase (beta-lactamase class C family)
MVRSRVLSAALLPVAFVVAACSSSSGNDDRSGSASAVMQPLINGGPKGAAPVGSLTPNEYTTTDITDGQVRAAVAKVDDIGATVMRRTGIPGMAIAVVHHGQVVYAKGFGVREVGKPDTVDPDTVFQIASLSKSISATCVAKAVTDKIVSWSDPVTKYLPTFTLADPAVTKMATIGDFFSHRTGLPGAAGDDLEGFGFDREQVLSRLHLFPLNPYRISYGYSNFGMTTGGEAVAAAAGMPWDQLCAKELFTPAKMTTASYSHQSFLQQPNRSAIHFEVDGAYKPLYQRDADPQAPAGGVSASVKDLAQWMSLVLAGGKVGDTQVIDPSVLQQGFTPQVVYDRATLADARSRFYGYGVNIDVTSTGHVRWAHSGAFYIGAATAYAMLPAADVGIVALTNAAPIGAPEAVTTTFMDLVRTGTVERDWLTYFGGQFATIFTNHSAVAGPPPASPKPARPLTDYVGTYTSAYLGDVTVAESGGALTVTLGPQNLSASLTHYDGDVFSWLTPGQTHDPVSAVTFGGSASGPTTTMSIEAVQIPDLTRK